jgi:site-specific DNA-cytosine methylase
VNNNIKHINHEDNIFSTLGTNCGSSTSAGGVVVVKDKPIIPSLRIRKLTPKECWRLMGFDDEDFEKASKVNSNAQLYKQAGNSIVVNVLEAIFKELI